VVNHTTSLSTELLLRSFIKMVNNTEHFVLLSDKIFFLATVQLSRFLRKENVSSQTN
jgi:hypothetical protein